MDMIEILTSVGSILGGLSIWEAIKYWVNRKTNKRKEEAEADASEFGVLREQIEFLQNQLKEKEERFADQTMRLRQTQDENFNLLKEKAMLEIELTKKGGTATKKTKK